MAKKGRVQGKRIHVEQINGCPPGSSDGQFSAVRRNGQAGDGPLVIQLQRISFLIFRKGEDVPEAHGSVVAATGQHFAVRRERHGPDGACVALERQHFFAGRYVPLPHGVVRAGGGQGLAIGGESYGSHRIVMAAQREILFAGISKPKTNGVVIARGGEKAAIRREGDGVHAPRLRFETDALADRIQVPDYHGGIVCTDGGERLAVGGNRQRRDAAGMPGGSELILLAQVMKQPPGKIAQITRATLFIVQQAQSAGRIRFPGFLRLGQLYREEQPARVVILPRGQFGLPVGLALLLPSLGLGRLCLDSPATCLLSGSLRFVLLMLSLSGSRARLVALVLSCRRHGAQAGRVP